jgi:23S rRNA pseudouridine1911/1915/1917 synthase
LAEEHQVPSPAPKVRSDAYCLGVFPTIASRSQAKRWIKKGHILCNGRQTAPEHYPRPGDILSIHPPETLLRPLPIAIETDHLDPHLAVVYKPAGLHVGGNHPKTLRRALLHNLPPSPEPDRLAQPEPVHRLDFRTQGLVIVARTAMARAKLGELIADREVRKCYAALAVGQLDGPGRCELSIDGKTALTTWSPVRSVPSLHVEHITLLEVDLHTGRTHQIRRHLHASGHPILGDDLYPAAKVLRGKGLFLAATGIAFVHPVTGGEVNIQREPPQKFLVHLDREERRWRDHQSTGS